MPIGSTTTPGHTQSITTGTDRLEVTEHLTVTYFLNLNSILIIAHAGISKLNFCFAVNKSINLNCYIWVHEYHLVKTRQAKLFLGVLARELDNRVTLLLASVLGLGFSFRSGSVSECGGVGG